MTESEYSQFLFEKHDPNKFNKYEEIKYLRGFRLPNDKNSTIYLLDDDGGWCDINGCYYNLEGEPSGWIILSRDGKKFMKFSMNSEFVYEKPNLYYSNKSFNIILQKQQDQQKQQPQIEFKKQQQNQPNQENQKKQENKKKDKQKVNDGEKVKYNQEKVKDQIQSEKEEQSDLYIEKIDKQLSNEISNSKVDQKNDQEKESNKQKDRQKKDKRNKNKKKEDNQNNGESKKYYILNINENTLIKEQFIKCLIEEYKIKEDEILEYNENILKLVQEKDAIKLYRLNQKDQTDKVQKFIVST
ncbi:unnamed protein product [Paramecium sonneborni]|uniref:Uncharacterized protein n=1 Tax=Paramecium sonneborni TaxID=65129 RepID=A0A8S1K9K1_9CILI|nr:unnamed protein product [Paramecium sonneborni]